MKMRSSELLSLAMSMTFVRAAFAADYYVNGVNGSDSNDGLSPGSAFQTLNTGFSSAYAANIAEGTNSEGRSLAASSVSLASGAGTYALTGGRNVEGGMTLAGTDGDATVELTDAVTFYVASRYSGHSTSPVNGSLLLQDVDWSKTAGSLCIGYNTAYAAPVEGAVSTEGGSFSVSSPAGNAYIGAYTGWDSNGARAQGSLVFGSETTPISLSFAKLVLGYREFSGYPTDGSLDARATTGGSLSLGTTLTVGYGGAPSVGNLLLGTNWTVSLNAPSSGGISIGSAGQPSTVATGVVSFAKGGSLAATVSTFKVAYNGSDGPLSGALLGGDGTGFSIAATNFYIGRQQNGGSGRIFGLVDFSASRGGSLTVESTFQIGCKGTRGELRLGEDATVRIGSPSKPVSTFGLGYDTSGSTGIVSMASGSFQAYAKTVSLTSGKSAGSCARIDTGTAAFTFCATTMYVGYDQDGSTVYGELDAGASTNAAFFCDGVLTLGYFTSARSTYGRLALGRGAGQTGTINMGVPGDPIENTRAGLLELNGFEMSITNAIAIRRSGKVVANVNGNSAGIGLAPGATLTFTDTRTTASGPAIDITFTALPDKIKPAGSAAADSILWGFKWAGDHVADVDAHLAAGRMAYDTSALDETAQAAGVFYDAATDATYIGLYTRVVKDGTILSVF